MKCEKLALVKDSKIPFYEKLPKESQFYKHYMNLLFTNKLV
jgi:hypothetical protein